ALALLATRGYPFWPIVIVATAGNYLGACTTYWIAKKAAALLRARRGESPPPREEEPRSRAVRMIAERGTPILLLSWVPLLGDALVAAAGAAGTPFVSFSLWTALGKFLRYAAVAWAAAAL
ncbi:MAG: VTT domain-containing protein, partial [Acidobacteria bacterium]|nr:VTT domain-containing protein [Acidobacteriota bacterium]